MTPEHVRAKAWRERMGLSLDQLSELSGYAVLTLRYMEKGLTPVRTARHVAGKTKSRKIPWQVWQRYKMVCAGVEYELTKGKFDW